MNNQTTYFRVDGFSAIRHDDNTRQALQQLKEKYPNKNQSDIIRDALVDYAHSFGYNGESAIEAQGFIHEKIATVLENGGYGENVCIISSSGIIKEALQYASWQAQEYA